MVAVCLACCVGGRGGGGRGLCSRGDDRSFRLAACPSLLQRTCSRFAALPFKRGRGKPHEPELQRPPTLLRAQHRSLAFAGRAASAAQHLLTTTAATRRCRRRRRRASSRPAQARSSWAVTWTVWMQKRYYGVCGKPLASRMRGCAALHSTLLPTLHCAGCAFNLPHYASLVDSMLHRTPGSYLAIPRKRPAEASRATCFQHTTRLP